MKKFLLCSVLSALGLLFPATLEAQHLGDVNLSTTQQTLFPVNTACTGSPQTAVINNQGGTSYSALALFTVLPTTAIYFIEGSSDGVNFTRVSDETDAPNAGGTLQASGYYTVIRVNMTCSPASGRFSIVSSTSGVPPSQPQGDGLRSSMEKQLSNGLAANAGQSGTFRPPYGNFAGKLFLTTSGAFAGAATISVTCEYVSGTGATQTFPITAGSRFSVAVSADPCAAGSWNYVAGTSTGLLGFEYVFSSGFSGSSGVAGGGTTNVQGVVADAASLATVNPVAVGGQTTPASACGNSVNKFATILATNAGDLSTAACTVKGFAIGAGNLNPQNVATGITFPNVGPMASAGFATSVSVTPAQSQNLWATPAAGFTIAGTGPGVFNNSPSGLLVNQNGYSQLFSFGNVTVNGVQFVTGNPWIYGTFNSCYFTLDFTSITGAATIDVWAQTALDGSHFLDRVHFAQATNVAATQHQAAAIGPVTIGIVPTATGAGKTLAVSTVLNGPIGAWIQFAWTVALGGGTVTGMVLGTACN